MALLHRTLQGKPPAKAPGCMHAPHAMLSHAVRQVAVCNLASLGLPAFASTEGKAHTWALM